MRVEVTSSRGILIWGGVRGPWGARVGLPCLSLHFCVQSVCQSLGFRMLMHGLAWFKVWHSGSGVQGLEA